MVAGCDIVYRLDRPMVQTVCGAFGGEVEVPFGEELASITDFSFNGTITRGFVRATVEATNGERTGPVPVLLDDDEWVYDGGREANWRILGNNDRIRVARMARDNEVFVGQQLTTLPPSIHVFHYAYLNNTWVQIETNEIAFVDNTDVYPGGELSEPVGTPGTFDFLPLFRFDKESRARTVAIATHLPGASTWEDDGSTGAINEQHQPWSGALARTPEGRQVLIYAATPEGSSEGSDLFMAEKTSDGFLPGVPLVGFNTSAEEVEPWISEDCTMITFRRAPRGAPFENDARSGGTIYMSTIL